MECSWDEVLLEAVPQLPDEILELIRHGTNDAYLLGLARAALHPTHAYTLLTSCDNLFVSLLVRIRQHASTSELMSSLGRVVPLAPHLADCAIALLSQHSFDFRSQSSADVVTRYLLGLFRLLRHDYNSFGAFADLSQISTLLNSPVMVHRYLAIRILQFSLDGADAWFENTLQTHIFAHQDDTTISGPWDDKVIDYRFLSLWEETRHTSFTARPSSTVSTAIRRTLHDSQLGDQCVRIGQTVLYSELKQTSLDSFIAVQSTTQNMQALGAALKQKKPILVTGPTSSGKTSLIRQAATRLGQSDKMIVLHLNEQSDAKLLLGVYTTGSTAGSIVWKAGVLTTAVQEGRWVLVEDLDRAPNHILGALLPLIETRTLSIASRKQEIHAHPSFRLIATYSTAAVRRDRRPLATMLGRRHWIDLDVQPISDDEVLTIVEAHHPDLAPLLPQMSSVFQEVRKLYAMPAFSARSRAGLIRSMGISDFFKWCSRATRHITDKQALTQEDIDNIFLEALDCFASALSLNTLSEEVTAIVAQHMHIDPQRRDFLSMQRPIKLTYTPKAVSVGRCNLPRDTPKRIKDDTFSRNEHVLRNSERIAASLQGREPVLLVGETGVGKTTSVQHLARQLGKKLIPFNLSQQSESGDLLGGLKPMDLRKILVSLKEEFDTLFATSFSQARNQQFIKQIDGYFVCRRYKAVCKLWRQALKMVEQNSSIRTQDDPLSSKKRKSNLLDPWRQAAWATFEKNLDNTEKHLIGGKDGLIFRFVESNIIKALRDGDWILLDEINLAASDTLDAITDMLDPAQPSILLAESGSTERIVAHPDFRVFAAMNPATDVGKKDLPPSIRSRFTEIYVSSPDKDLKSLQDIVRVYLESTASLDTKVTLDVSLTYQQIVSLSAQNKLVDGAGQRPHFSLRTLTRVLSYAKFIAPQCSLRRALYEGFQMSFMTFLDMESVRLVLPIVEQHLLRKPTNWPSELKKVLRKPEGDADYVLAYPSSKHWIRRGKEALQDQEHYIITPFVERNLENLVRATSTSLFPVLIQGPTSSGKTSMIEYLAKRTGNVFMRINNHEHTDLQEYLGTYVSEPDGSIEWQEGLLVRALRKGFWIVLDELNLAPTDVLEALNRLLDDNRELLIPETQETVRPHPGFMLFATQNPAGLYGGRKTLSRAFRNRFLELHFDDIPIDELQEILHRRTQQPESRCKKIVAVYRELSVLRQENRLFEQKSFATLRDLFRWAMRDNDTIQDLANNGFLLLGERVRKPQEREAIKTILERVMSARGPQVRINEETLYNLSSPELHKLKQAAGHSNVVWTRAMRRLFTLVANALKYDEPVLLIGDTGCGKTTVCQMIAEATGSALNIVNAHQNTETSDLIGSQRPIRNRAARQVKALFEWVDGSLVQAMKQGTMFLLDEISLADDSVLERMNSVLEPTRTVLLAEKGTIHILVRARPGFQFLATMNPGGDYGKKELSPALRNRFTEIWVPMMTDTDDLTQILQHSLCDVAKPVGMTMLAFAQWFSSTFRGSDHATLTTREMLAWAAFVNRFAEFDLSAAILHGASLVYIDTLGANPAGLTNTSNEDVRDDRERSLRHLGELLQVDAEAVMPRDYEVKVTDDEFTVGPFSIARRHLLQESTDFNFAARATRLNTLRVIRAMQLPKPIMLEGNPGVGKTALVTAIAVGAGVPLTRINLSDQTDLIDLFGSDVPVDGSVAGTFRWREAPFLRAMKSGHWVLLDEMNLASQSVLEGLNAVLDHRGEAYIPELGLSFAKHPEFRLFAAQNPHHQGGGRKGLPASFVNRFTVVYAHPFDKDDLQMLSARAFPNVPADQLSLVVDLVSAVEQDVCQRKLYGQAGAPWEFNFRDISKWLQLASSGGPFLASDRPWDFADFLLQQRFRTDHDRKHFAQAFENSYHMPTTSSDRITVVGQSDLQIGISAIQRDQWYGNHSYRSCGDRVEAKLIQHVSLCVQFAWPVLLIGSSGSGKTSTIHQLAAVTGNEVVTISLNADTDTMDLIGSYEQADEFRDVQAHLRSFDQVSKSRIKQHGLDADGVALLSHMHVFRKLKKSHQDGLLSLADLRTALKTLRLPSVQYLDAKLVPRKPDFDNTAVFVWVDGILVDALRTGKWIILDNANLCSASVLDRLNSLLEKDGKLIINENVIEDGGPTIVVPHQNCRIFLTADPQFGELSRAMRNRAVELYTTHRSAAQHSGTVLNGESSMQHFRETALVLSSIDGSVNMESRAMATQQLAHFNQRDVTIFESQLSQGLLGVETSRPVLTPKSELLPFQARALLGEQLATLYSEAAASWRLSADFACKQTNHPLHHQLLLSHTESLSTRAIRIGFCCDLLNAIQPVLQKIETLRSDKACLTRLLRIDAQHFSHSNVNAEMPLTIALVEQHVRDIVKLYLTNGPAVSSYADARRLVVIWSAMLDAAAKGNFNAAQLLSFTILIKQHLEDSDASITSLAQNAALGVVTQQSRSVLSCEAMWTRFKPQVLSDPDKYMQSQTFQDLCHHFDAQPNSGDGSWIERATLRLSLHQAFKSAQHDRDVDLRPLIAQLQTLTMDEEHDLTAATPHFRSHFRSLWFINRHEHTSTRPSPQLSQLIGVLGGIPLLEGSISDISIDGHDLAILTPSQIGHDGALQAGQLSIDALAQTLDTTDNVTLKYMATLKTELTVMSEAIFGHSEILHHSEASRLALMLAALSESLRTVISSSSSTSVADVFANVGHLELAMRNLIAQISCANDEGTPASRWWAIGLIGLQLYLPSIIYDPALTPILDMETYDAARAEMSIELGSIELIHRRISDQNTSWRAQVHASTIEGLGPRPVRPDVLRPNQSQIVDLYNDLQPLRGLINAMSMSDIAVSHAGLLPQQASNLVSLRARLVSTYASYHDFVGPIIAFIDCLLIGRHLGMIRLDERASNISLLVQHVPFCSQAASYAGPEQLLELVSDDMPVVERLFWLQIVTNRFPHWQKSPCSSEFLFAIAQHFMAIYSIWQKQLTLDQRQHAAKSSLFKYRSAEDDDDEAQLAAEIEQLFSPADIASQRSAKTMPFDRMHDAAASIAAVHSRVFQDHDLDATGLLRLLDIARVVLATGIESNSNVIPLSALLQPLHELTHELSAEAPPLSYNFYKHSCPAKTNQLKSVLSRIRHRFHTIHEEWPEHAIPIDIIRMVEVMLHMPYTSTLPQFLQPLEKLYSLMNEWQKIAHSGISASEYYDVVTDMIIDWRRLELSTWAALFDEQDKQCRNDAMTWWFTGYETMIATLPQQETEIERHLRVLIGTLQAFLESCGLGEYNARLELLSSFVAHARAFSSLDSKYARLASAVHGFIAYYKRYGAAVDSRLQQGRTKLEKTIKETIQLASWKDRNIDSLRQSAQSSHNKLARILRKYRALLAEPVGPLVVGPVVQPLTQPLATELTPYIYDFSISDDIQEIEEPIWTSRPARYKNIDATCKLIVQKTIVGHETSDVANRLTTFLADVKQSVKELRSATPSVKTEENAGLLGQLKSRKRRVLADVLKTLRLMGLRQHMSEDALARQSSLAEVLPRLEVDTTADHTGRASNEDSLHNILAIMPKVREGMRKHSDDLTSNETKRCVTLLESCLALAIEQHNELGIMEAVRLRAGKTLSALNLVSSADYLELCPKERLDALLSSHKVQLALLAAFKELVQKHDELVHASHASHLVTLDAFLAEGAEQMALLKRTEDLPQGLLDAKSLCAVENLESILLKANDHVRALAEGHPELKYITSSIGAAGTRTDPALSMVYKPDAILLDVWIGKAFAALDATLARVDKLEQAASSVAQDEYWLIGEQFRLHHMWRHLSAAATLDQFDDILANIASMQSAKIASASRVLSSISSIFNAYCRGVDNVVRRYQDLHHAVLAMTFDLASLWTSLADNGFCAPADKQESADTSTGKVESGTGLGDGEGADDVSKDVKQDEDLSELAQQEGQKEREDGIEDAKDAVDMADEDLQGELGDADDGSQSDGAEKDEQDQTAIDEEVGSVHSDDADALDEKTWDDGKLDEGKSKEDDKSKGMKSDDIAAAQEPEVGEQDGQREEAQDETSNNDELDDNLVEGAQENNQLQPHTQDEQVLDLPEDLNMDKGVSDDDLSGSDLDMDDASQGENAESEQKLAADAEDVTLEDQLDLGQQAELENGLPEDQDDMAENEDDENLLQNNEEQDHDMEQDDGEIAGEPGLSADNQDTQVQPIQSTSQDRQQDANPEDEEMHGHNTQQDVTGAQGKSESTTHRSQDAQQDDSAVEGDARYEKLGDVLEQWHKQREAITQPESKDTESEEQKNAADDPSQFEHLQDEDAEADTQALGTGSMEQSTAFPDDVDMHDDDEEEAPPKSPSTTRKDDTQDDDQGREASDQVAADLPTTSRPKAVIGKDHTAADVAAEMDEDEEGTVDDMDVKLDNTHISLDPQAGLDMAEARKLWTEHESNTRQLSLMLTEHLRLILHPTQATKMRGDFRTGKRLNIKKIIPFIASSYRRDKIWMRRSIPSKRNYQIMLAIDDSKSMAEGDNQSLAYNTLALVSRALAMLEVGELCVVSFGDQVKVAHDFTTPFANDAGPELFRSFTFNQDHTDIRRLLTQSIELFRAARLRATGSASDLWQLQIIISDGVCEDHAGIRQLVRQAREERIMIVFVVVDTLLANEATSEDKKLSILDLQKAEFTKDAAGEMQLQMVKYLDTFPFGYYLLVSDVRELPGVLAGALRQWFAEVADTGSA